MRRPEPAPALAAGGGLVLLVSLFLDWYTPGISAFTAFEVLDLVLAALALAALAPGVAAVAGSAIDASGLDLAALERALPVVAGLALLVVLSQAINHPPAAVGEEARAGQWIALVSALALAGAAVLATRQSTAPLERRSSAPGRRVRGAPDAARSRPPAQAEARAAEPEVMEELYPDVERTGPIGGDDPEVARAAPLEGDGPPPSPRT